MKVGDKVIFKEECVYRNGPQKGDIGIVVAVLYDFCDVYFPKYGRALTGFFTFRFEVIG